MQEKSRLAVAFGKVLSQQRALTDKMSQVTFAKKSGITVRHISREALINEHRTPSLQTILDLTEGLGITPEELMAKLMHFLRK